MKRILLLLAVALLAVSALTACGTTGGSTTEAKGTFIVGTPKLNGDFIAGFGNSSYDKSVRDMLWALPTYTTTPGGEFLLDETVVKAVETSVDDAGNKTYKFTLNSGLKWSDGSDVTAKDYVFGILFAASPEWVEAGNSDTAGDSLLGYAAYHAGETEVFEGVKLLGDLEFSVTIGADFLPYFYEVAYAAFGPSPMAVWAPDLTIGEDGSSLVGDVAAVATSVATTERFAPSVTSGPFTFESFENDVVTLQVNPNYAGDYRGEKAKVATVIVKYVDPTTDVDLVISGDIDLVAGVVEGAKIEKAKASDQADVVSYKRNGYGMIAFANDFGPTKENKVRQALAYLIDRNTFLVNILGGYGAMVNGEYGLSQWMYTTQADVVESTLVNYTFNVDKANELLDSTEWKFEADGVTPWDATKAADGYWRYNANKEVLQINHLGTTGNPITDLIGTEWPKGLNRAGVKFTIEWQDFNSLLANYYYSYELDPAERKYHSFNLATGFTEVYDPYYSFHSDFLGTWQNATQTNDSLLDFLMEKMRSLDPTDKETYASYWLEYQVRWNELLPVLPIYSNEYFDVFNVRVSGLSTTPTYGWARAILDVTVAE
ncbi:MAG: ABC transporter substrate-binding protein [Erysipelotrichaceae bacterium]|nr:ABC transporter substrate-binding protein [Erysipelotrichaceae bacterium]